MRASPKRLALVSLLGAAIVAGISGLTVLDAESRSGYVPILLLGAFSCAALISLFLLIRLMAQTDERDRANRELAVRNRELQAATEAKSRFVATVSHELRNPLNAVIGYAELMHDGRLGELAPGQRQHLGVIRASGQHILSLIEDLLDVARIEAGHIRLRPEPIDPAQIASGCVTALSRVAETRAVRVSLDASPGSLFLMDPTRLRQVILNYLSNALKFTPAGGEVTVRVSHRGGRLRVEVADPGPGIEPAAQAHMFEEFFQAPGAERSGTGLGLAVTKLIVEAQGGEVGLESRPGHGSTFSALLPAPVAPPSAAEPAAARSAPGGPAFRDSRAPALAPQR